MRFAVPSRFASVLIMSTAIAAGVLTDSAIAQKTDKAGAATPPAATPPAAAAPTAAAPAAGSSEGASAKDLLEKGEAALKAGDFAAAINAFTDADKAASQPGAQDALRDHYNAMTGRGRTLTAMKESQAAYDELSSVLGDEPKWLPALVARGKVLIDMNRIEDALADFQNAVKIDMSNAEAQFGLGKTLVMMGRGDEAVSPLTRAIAADPNNSESLRLRGQANAVMYKLKAAKDDLEQAIKVNPDDYDAYFLLGLLHYRAEDYQGAVQQFTLAIDHYKPKPGYEELPYQQGYLRRADAYMEIGKAAKDPAAKNAAFKQAFADIERLISQLDQKNPAYTSLYAEALLARGVAERMLGELGTAVRTLTKAIELRSTARQDERTASFLSDAYFRRGICFHLIGEDKMAISDFEISSHLAFDDPRANLWAGFTYAKMGDYHKALRAYGDAIAASDRYTPAYYNRALAYMALGEYAKAVVDFNDAIRLDPTNAEYYFKRGVAYQQLKDDQKASESFAAALQFDDKHVGSYRHLADVLERLGRTELANQYRQKAEQLAPPKKAS